MCVSVEISGAGRVPHADAGPWPQSGSIISAMPCALVQLARTTSTLDGLVPRCLVARAVLSAIKSLLVREKKANKKTSLTALGLLNLRDSAIIILMESIVIFLFPSKTSPVDVPQLPLPDQHKHFNAVAPVATACQGRDAAKSCLPWQQQPQRPAAAGHATPSLLQLSHGTRPGHPQARALPAGTAQFPSALGAPAQPR